MAQNVGRIYVLARIGELQIAHADLERRTIGDIDQLIVSNAKPRGLKVSVSSSGLRKREGPWFKSKQIIIELPAVSRANNKDCRLMLNLHRCLDSNVAKFSRHYDVVVDDIVTTAVAYFTLLCY